MTMRVVELFSGAGGMSLGLTQAGLSVVLAYELEGAMRRVYRRNMAKMPHLPAFGSTARFADLTEFPNLVEEIIRKCPDVIVGGPPCQDFSAAGKLELEGARAQLTKYYAQLLAVVRPQWFVLENVTGALRSRQYKVAKDILKRSGYRLSEHVLLASRYGVPQRRKRLILIGRLGEMDGFLDSALIGAASKDEMSITAALGDRFGEALYLHPVDPDRRAVWKTTDPAPTIRSASGRNPPAGFELRPVDKYEGAFCNPAMEELALLQGFPAWWDWSGETAEKTSVMIGNCVPPPLAKAIGTCIRERHEGQSTPALPDGFNGWLAERGYTPPSVRNIRSRVKAGRRLLKGRTFANPAHELGELEVALNLTEMSVRGKSDIRSALRLHREYLDHLAAQQMAEEARIEARRDKKRSPSAREFEKIREGIRSTFHIPRVRSSREPEFIDDPRDEAV